MLALGTDRLEAAAAYLGRGASRFWGPSFLPFCIHSGQFFILAEFWEKVQRCVCLFVLYISASFSLFEFSKCPSSHRSWKKQNAIPLGKLSLKKSLDFAKYFMMGRAGGLSDFTYFILPSRKIGKLRLQ